MQPITKSDLMVEVENLKIERDGWRDTALQSMAAEVLLTAAVTTHRDSPQVDGWGHYKPDADLALWNVLDKIEAHQDHATTPRSARVSGADAAPNGRPDAPMDLRGLRSLFGGSD